MSAKPLVLTVYRDAAGRWRWRARSGNHIVIADSAQAYSRHDVALRAAHGFLGAMRGRVLIKVALEKRGE